MTAFKKLKNKFATIQNNRDDRLDVWVGSKEFWKACKWFYKQGKKGQQVIRVPAMQNSYWQPIKELTDSQGLVLGRCGNEFSLIEQETAMYDTGLDVVRWSKETHEPFDAREFMVIPLSNRTEVEVTYSAKGLVLGITWEGAEGTYPLRQVASCGSRSELQVVLDTFLQTNALTGTGDFSKQLGAILVITKSTTIMVNGKPFVNTEVSREFIGELSAEQMDLLKDVV